MTRIISSLLRSAMLLPAVLACSSAGRPAATAAATASAAPALPQGVTPAMIAAGDTIFNTRSCKNCHLANGIGGPRGPNLRDSQWIHVDGSYPSIVTLVTTGFTKAEQKDPQYPFAMNPRGGVRLTDAEIAAVAAYVWRISH